MRRVRSGRSKDLGPFLNMALIFQGDWLTYLLVFFCALLGTLIGLLLGKITPMLIILLLVIFLGLVTAGLLVAWAINRKNQLLENFTLQESFKEQYNAFRLLIGELEYNLNAESGGQVQTNVWQELKYKYSYFPAYIYDSLEHTYSCLAELEELDIAEYRRVIIDELNLPDLISQLKDWQQKLKRQLAYLD